MDHNEDGIEVFEFYLLLCFVWRLTLSSFLANQKVYNESRPEQNADGSLKTDSDSGRSSQHYLR